MDSSIPIKILVIDDEPLLKSLLLQSFESQIIENRWKFIFANDGVEALKILEEDAEIGVILTDINMPQMDGLTFLDKISQQDRLYRTVVVSAYGDMRNIRGAMNRGAADFVVKPIDMHDLEKTLSKIISQYHLLKEGLAVQQQNIEFHKELEISSQIQHSFIPKNFNLFEEKNIEIYGEMLPAKQVGGDFFDLIKIDENHIMFVVGDVSGKGIPAALFMAVCQTLLHAVALNTHSIEECICKVDDILSANNESMMFVTCFCAVLETHTGLLHYCNAGHVSPLIVSANGNIQQIGHFEGMALGINLLRPPEHKHSIFQVHTVQLKPHDLLVLYSDGVTEAMNSLSEFYSGPRFIRFMKENYQKSVHELVNAIKEELASFTLEMPQADDITILIVKYLGNK